MPSVTTQAAGNPESARPRYEVADIFREYSEQYRRSHPLPLSHLKVMHAIEVCRTAYLGGHVERCEGTYGMNHRGLRTNIYIVLHPRSQLTRPMPMLSSRIAPGAGDFCRLYLMRIMFIYHELLGKSGIKQHNSKSIL
jgi:hypothetical protein